MRRGIKTIIAGVMAFVAGAFVIPLAFILPILLGNSQEIQFKVPGTAEATVKDAGRYYLWNDFETVYEGKSYNRSKGIPDGLEIKIRDADGHPLQFTSDASTSISSGRSSKNSIGYVEIDRPGKVQIDISGGNEERIFSFSQSRLLKIFGQIAGGAGLSLLVAALGLVLVVWGIVKLVIGGKTR